MTIFARRYARGYPIFVGIFGGLYTRDEVIWDFSCAAIEVSRKAQNVGAAKAAARLCNAARGFESK